MAILVCGRSTCAPLGDSSRTHQATGVARHLLFPVGSGSTCFLAIRHLADVGISGPLQTGLGFFGLLNAVSASLPYGWGGHQSRGPEQQRFHVLHSIQDGFRSALLHRGSLWSSRRVTLDNPDSTACPFGWSLNQPRMAPCSYSAYERLVSFDPVLRLWLSPGLRLPGLIHFREGSTPLAVAATQPLPVRRMLPWNTCGDTQGLVRTFIQPSSIECNFMSQLTTN